MKLIIYTQIGFMGGSLRILLNLGKFLSEEHQVVILAPKLNLHDEPGMERFPNLMWSDTRNPSLEIPETDLSILHLPKGADLISRQIRCSKILVVFEIMSRHPFKLEKKDSRDFKQVIYIHHEQEEALLRTFEKERCVQLPIINSIDFELPFKKTLTSASIGTGIYKHDLPSILKVLLKSQAIDRHIIYMSTRVKPEMISVLSRFLLFYYLKNKRLIFSGIEWDLRKMYSSFDCLLHFPGEGNGTSMVVSEALSCGKMVVLAPLPAYKVAYSGITGVYFTDETGFSLSALIRNYNQGMAEKIREDYRKNYDRDLVLLQWKNVIAGVRS